MSAVKTVFIAGPTASGKTDLAVRLALAFGGEIVSADSMQIYRGIHIASAAPDEAEKQGVPHHLLEFLEPTAEYSVAEYTAAANRVIGEISARGHLPIVVGGTGLYISALADGIVFTEEKTDRGLRRELEERMERLGAEQMLQELAGFDPETAARLHPNDRRRIIRAFEIYTLTGHTLTEQNMLSKQGNRLIEPLLIGLTYRDRAALYARIDARVDQMLANGLAEEAKAASALQNGGAVQAIGHKELAPYLRGECSLAEAADHLKQQTRRYAKRQLTWFRREERMRWLYADEGDPFLQAAEWIKEFLKKEETP